MRPYPWRTILTPFLREIKNIFFKKGIDKSIDKCYNKHIKKKKIPNHFLPPFWAVCGLPSFFLLGARTILARRIFRIVRQFRFFRGNRTIRLGGSNSRNCLNCLTILKIKNSLNFQKIQTL